MKFYDMFQNNQVRGQYIAIIREQLFRNNYKKMDGYGKVFWKFFIYFETFQKYLINKKFNEHFCFLGKVVSFIILKSSLQCDSGLCLQVSEHNI